MTRLVLASGSVTRAELLRRAGLEIEIRPPGLDEESIRAALAAEGIGPRDTADALAEQKALKISYREPDALVIGCDQVADLGGETLSKPRDRDDAKAQLRRMRGRMHMLHSAGVVAERGQPIWRHVDTARLHVRACSDDWLEGYVTRNWDRIQHSAGCYLIEEEGVRLFDRIDGNSFAIMGMPLVQLLSWLALRGSIPG